MKPRFFQRNRLAVVAAALLGMVLTAPAQTLLLSNGFNSASLPSGWTTNAFAAGSGTGSDPAITFVASSTYSNAVPYEGSYFVKFNSWDCRTNAQLRLVSPVINAGSSSNLSVQFAWHHDPRTGKDSEGVTLQWTTNDWAATSNIVPFQMRRGSPTNWVVRHLALPQQAVSTNLKVGLLFNSQYGNNCYLDDFRVFASPAVTNYPYSENFDSGLGIWSGVPGADFTWTRWSGYTPSGAVAGQTTGVSAAQSGSYYLYTEASDPNYPSKSALLGAPFDFSGLQSPRLWFYYHMCGDGTGTLYAEVSPNGGASWLVAWSKTGEQQPYSTNGWARQTANLIAYGGMKNIRIRFRGVTGTNGLGDMAIDTVSVTESVNIRSQGFEGTDADPWTYTLSPEAQGAVVATSRVSSGSYSMRLQGSANGATNVDITFTNVSLVGYTNVSAIVPFGADGVDSGDDLHFFISYDGGGTWNGTYGTQIGDGNNNLDLAFTQFVPDRTVGGGNSYLLNIPGDKTQAMVRLRYYDVDGVNNGSDYYFVDDVKLVGQPLNAAPTDIQLSSQSIAENAGANAVVGALSATDALGGAMEYSLVAGSGDTDNGAFNISSSNLRANASFDYETQNSYSVRIQAQDSGGLAFSKSFAIAVTNVYELSDECPVALDAVCLSNSVPTNGAHVTAGAAYTKTWVMSNSGTLAWASNTLDSFSFGRGDNPASSAAVHFAAAENVAPAATRAFSVTFTAPTNGGISAGFWSLRRNGTNFGERVWLDVVVDTPDIAITNAQTTFASATASAGLGGTKHSTVVGTMRWTNALTGAGGTFAAASPWAIAGIALASGDNSITVSGTNSAGVTGSATIVLTRLAAPTVTITTADATVSNVVASTSISGTAGSAVAGTLTWTNSLGGSGSIPASTSWTIPDVALAVGTNVVTVTATNSAGESATDSVQFIREAGTAANALIDEPFDAAPTAPAGWTFTGASSYTTASYAGRAIPSVKFDSDGDTITSTTFSGGTNVQFWMRAVTSPGTGTFVVAQYSGGSWSTLGVVTNPSNVGTTYSMALSESVTQLKFTWNKTSSNIAFDDVIVTGPGSQPVPDSDGDGMPDDYENTYFNGATNGLAGGDDDDDGVGNLSEYIAGTNPKTNASVLAVASLTPNTNTATIVFRWPSATGRVYSIWRATNAAGDYTQHVGSLAANWPTNAYTNAAPTNAGTYYYGLKVSWPDAP